MSAAPDYGNRFTGKTPGKEAEKPPSIVIEGVPASVTREQIDDAIRLLGIDPKEVYALRFDFLGIEVEVYSVGKPGVPGYRWTHDGKEMATHRLVIPVLDKGPSG